jgi:hypothetical protein
MGLTFAVHCTCTKRTESGALVPEIHNVLETT